MALTTIPAAGAKLRGSVLNSLITEVRTIFVRKTSDETVTSAGTGSTLQDDDELLVALAANHTYVFEANIYYSSGATPNIKFAFSFPALATCSYTSRGYATGGANLLSSHAFNTYQGASGTATLPMAGSAVDYPVAKLSGIIRTGANAGNLRLQFAQDTADAGNTTVKADSWLEARMMA